MRLVRGLSKILFDISAVIPFHSALSPEAPAVFRILASFFVICLAASALNLLRLILISPFTRRRRHVEHCDPRRTITTSDGTSYIV